MSVSQVNSRDISPNDIIIAVMGPTGTGKSTFISIATRKHDRSIGHDLDSYTSKIQSFRFPHPKDGRLITFVDTPGFDDTHKSDTEILKMIASWLEKTYKRKITLAGIIYLHRVSDNRMAGTPLKNLRMFSNLCGKDATGNVILATTMWGLVEEGEGKRRSEQLQAKYWKGMLENGSKIMPFLATFESAWNIVDIIVGKRDLQKQSLLIQQEMVDLHRVLGETQAGIALYNTLQQLLADQREEVRRLRDEANAQHDPQLARALNARYEEIQENLHKTFDQVKEMKVPLGRRILGYFKAKKNLPTIPIPNA